MKHSFSIDVEQGVCGSAVEEEALVVQSAIALLSKSQRVLAIRSVRDSYCDGEHATMKRIEREKISLAERNFAVTHRLRNELRSSTREMVGALPSLLPRSATLCGDGPSAMKSLLVESLIAEARASLSGSRPHA